MKKYFMLGLAVIFVLTLGLIAYGAYLNQQGELQIMHRMEERALPVHGAEAEVRELHPRIYLPALNLQAPEMESGIMELTLSLAEPIARLTEKERKGIMETATQKEIFSIAKEAGFFA